MKKIAAFPYNNDLETLIENRKDCKDFYLENILLYKSDFSLMEDLNGRKELKYYIDYEKAISQVDAVLLCPNLLDLDITSYFDVIDMANHLDKEILIDLKLFSKLSKEMKDVTIINTEWPKQKQCDHTVMKKIDVPIISILGLGENTSKFRVQIALRNSIENIGYNVLSICSNALGSLLGMDSLPEFLFGNTLTFEEKIINFNNMLYQKVYEKKPDVILLGVPGGIMPFNEYCNNYFSESSLVLMNAVESDIGVLCTYLWPSVKKKFFKMMDNLCTVKFGSKIDAFIVSSQDNFFDVEDKKMKYRFFDNDFCKKNFPKLENLGYLVCSDRDEKGFKYLVDSIILKLRSNLSMV